MHIGHIPTSLKGWCESKHSCSEAEHSWIFKYLTFLDLGNQWEDIRIGARNHAGMYAMMLVSIFDFVLTVLQFIVFTGSKPEHKKIDGQRNWSFWNMRWNEQQGHCCRRHEYGRIGLKSRTPIRDQKHMLLGSCPNGGPWQQMRIACSNRQIVTDTQNRFCTRSRSINFSFDYHDPRPDHQFVPCVRSTDQSIWWRQDQFTACRELLWSPIPSRIAGHDEEIWKGSKMDVQGP